MRRSEPLDLDRVARAKRYAISNPAGRSQIGRPRAAGRSGGGATGGARRRSAARSPEMAKGALRDSNRPYFGSG